MRETELRALEIVENCLDLDEGERDAFLAERCAEAPALRARVDQILAMDETRFRLLPTQAPESGEFVPDAVPERIGPFRVTGIIGRGGMGTVVRAERDDGVYSQTVAIKLIRAGLHHPQAKERFALERRILARLSHPGIARILDGGAQDGRPYLVMEYVEGQAITIALDRGKTTIAERLDAFEQVCDAVSHAHRNLVVHADIKPSNVIAATDGGIKLLDFGISRLIVDLDRDEIEGPHGLTQGYAAPERLSGQPPSVAGDVYSLGALLHELLSGRRPDRDGATSGLRAAEPKAGSGMSRQEDLEAIVAKATAADAGERYPDVAALAADIKRYRQARPVLARAQTLPYRADRFVRRNRWPIAIGAAVLILLSSATAISVDRSIEAERQRAEAEQRFDEVRRLARLMLFDIHDELTNAPGTVRARMQIAQVTARYLDKLRRVPNAPADLRVETATGYRRLATVQGVPGGSSLGLSAEAERSLALAEALLASVLGEEPRNAAAHEEMGWVTLSRWALSADNSQSPLVNRAARRAFEAALAVDPRRTGARLGHLTTAKNEGYDLMWADRPKEALPILRKALAELRALRVEGAQADDAALLEVNLLNRIGDAIYYSGGIPASLASYEEANALVDARLARRETPRWLDRRGEAMWNLSGTLADIPGRAGDALAASEKGLAAMKRVLDYGPDAGAEKRLLVLHGQKALILSAMGRHKEAVQPSALSLSIREARYRAEPRDPSRLRDLVVALTPHAEMLARAGDRTAACASVRRATPLWERLRRQGQLSAFDAARNLPLTKAAQSDYCG